LFIHCGIFSSLCEQIVEEGTHNSLLTQGGKYATLYKQYFEHQSLDWEPNQGTLKIE